MDDLVAEIWRLINAGYNNNNNKKKKNEINDTFTVGAISDETGIAGAIEGLIGVCARGVHVTVVTHQLAFVDKHLCKKLSYYVSAALPVHIA